ncbi:hypothetical protein LRN42_000066 [Shigella sonnei]|nr:hypothetical protein [Shigella sonnei]
MQEARYHGSIMLSCGFVIEHPIHGKLLIKEDIRKASQSKNFSPLLAAKALLASFDDIDVVVYRTPLYQVDGYNWFDGMIYVHHDRISVGVVNLDAYPFTRLDIDTVQIDLSSAVTKLQGDDLIQDVRRFWSSYQDNILIPVPDELSKIYDELVSESGDAWWSCEDPYRFFTRKQKDRLMVRGWIENPQGTVYHYVDAEAVVSDERYKFDIRDEQLIWTAQRLAEQDGVITMFYDPEIKLTLFAEGDIDE